MIEAGCPLIGGSKREQRVSVAEETGGGEGDGQEFESGLVE